MISQKIKNSDTAAAGAFTSSSRGVGPIRVQADEKRSSSDKCRIIARGEEVTHAGIYRYLYTRHCISSAGETCRFIDYRR